MKLLKVTEFFNYLCEDLQEEQDFSKERCFQVLRDHQMYDFITIVCPQIILSLKFGLFIVLDPKGRMSK